MKQARLLVFGASGRTGGHLVTLARNAGWSVVGAVRDPARAAPQFDTNEFVVCDVLSAAATREALAKARPNVVISTLGGSDLAVDDLGVRHVADACVAAGVRRLIVVTSLGCGGSRAHASPRLLAAIGDVLAAKTRAEEHIAGAALDWTIVRPGRLIEAEPTGGALLSEDETVHGEIACADLAGLLLRLTYDAASVRRVLAAVDPSRSTR